MFKSKKRPIVICQREHARLAGVMAAHWGNEQFDLPTIPFDTFVKGVTFHDRGYRVLDNDPIGEIDDDTWLNIMRAGIDWRFDDAIADIMVLMHSKRLLVKHDTHGRNELAALATEKIEQRLAECDFSLDTFAWIDRITAFCDSVAFNFAFGNYALKTVMVYSKSGTTEKIDIHYSINSNGEINISPWPFSVDHLSGFVIGYELDGYPDKLEPVTVPWKICPSSSP